MALPDKPESIPENQFLRFNFKEGVRWSDIWCFLKLFVYLWKNKSKIEYVHYFSTKLILIGPVLARIAGVQSISTVTGFGRTFINNRLIYTPLRKLYMFLLAVSLYCQRALLFQNHGDLQLLKNRFPSARCRFVYVGSGVDFNPIVAHSLHNYLSEDINILMVTRIHPTKGVEDFLRISNMLSGKKLHFTLVGPPSRGGEKLMAKVKQLDLSGSICYRGELTGKKLHDVYRNSHIFLFPSYYGEGMPRVMLEAGFMGLCPVAYDINANKDIVGTDSGILVPTHDWEKAVMAIKELIHDREKLAFYAMNFQNYILANYSIQDYIDRYNNVLENLNLGT